MHTLPSKAFESRRSSKGERFWLLYSHGWIHDSCQTHHIYTNLLYGFIQTRRWFIVDVLELSVPSYTLYFLRCRRCCLTKVSSYVLYVSLLIHFSSLAENFTSYHHQSEYPIFCYPFYIFLPANSNSQDPSTNELILGYLFCS